MLRFLFTAALIVMGLAWGLTMPLTKIAVSEGYRHFGLIFWQTLIGAVILGIILVLRRRPLPLTAPALMRYALIGLIGALIPDLAWYESARHLPGGIIALVSSLSPMLAFPVALAMGNERFAPSSFWRQLGGRVLGLSLGFAGVLLIVLPDTSLPDPAMAIWLPLAMIAPLCYALEGNGVAKWGMGGMDPLQLLCGASLLASLISLPLAIGTGHWITPLPPYGLPDLALLTSAILHVFTYTTYVWLVSRAGPSFAVQVSYLVTGFGVIWSMLLLGERFSLWVWAAMAVMLLGVALVQPRGSDVDEAGRSD